MVINKAVSVYIGPTGLALIGQFQNFSQLVMTVAQGGITIGVTKYTAEYGKDDPRTSAMLSTATKISVICSLCVGVLLVLLSHFASLHFLKSSRYTYIFVIFGFSLVLFVLNNLLLAVLNGLKEIKTLVGINIVQSLTTLALTTLLIVLLGLDGALLALATNQSIIFFILLFLLRKHEIIRFENLTKAFSSIEGKRLLRFAAMALTSAATVPVSQLVIRNHIGEELGWAQAGYWQAIWYISSMYLMVVTNALGIYYLPRLSEISDKAELRKELLGGYKIILPTVIGLSLTIFLLKDFIIWLLFTPDFAPMRELFLWQLTGDVVKIAAWLLAYLMLAKVMTKTYIYTEIAFSVSFVLLGIASVNQFGLVGITYAYVINYMAYCVVIALVTRKVWI